MKVFFIRDVLFWLLVIGVFFVFIIVNVIYVVYVNLMIWFDDSYVYGFIDWYGFVWWFLMFYVFIGLVGVVLLLFVGDY